MLLELSVQNLLLIEEARLELSPGLNVLTGETGAGKTMLAHALDLLLGGRARSGIVRPGAQEAYVEGIFELRDDIERPEQLAEDAQELILARRVGVDGRTRAYLNGRAISVTQLRDIAAEQLSFYGQHEHRKLMLGAAQLEILDGFCGAEQVVRRQACADSWRALHAAREELARLRELDGARERELDLAQFELAEIDEVAPTEEESATLNIERERLRHVAALQQAAANGMSALDGDEGGATIALGAAAAAMESLAGVDEALDVLGVRAQALAIEANDLLSELRAYGEGLEQEPGRLEFIEERLAAIARLERKHGGSVAAVLEHAERCRVRVAELLDVEVAMQDADAQLQQCLEAHMRSCEALHAAREAQALPLATTVCERLEGLAMGDAAFDVVLTMGEPGPTGADVVQFEIAPNPGVASAPLREVASGGELSRVMLALLGAANADSAATLVFDEVDAGIGGHTARAVGSQLRDLAQGRQIVCITHLPQVASLAQRHFTIVKDTESEPAKTTVLRLEKAEVVGELVRMLGADDDDSAAKRHARELLRAA